MNKSIFSLECVLLLVFFVMEIVVGQVEYPEQLPIDKKKSNAEGRSPLYSPTRCRKNELLYPGDQVNDWICDCAPASIYFPEADACYPAFRQGPCEKNQMLVLGLAKVIPECIANVCKVDGQVQIKNVCYEFGRNAPCQHAEYTYVLGVDPATLQVDCVKQSITLGMRFGDEDAPDYDLSTIDLCPRGCKRAIEGRCPERN